MPPSLQRHLAALFCFVTGLCVGSTRGDTFVFPHILEQSGSILDSQFTFDTTLFVTYSDDLAGVNHGGQDATVDVYLFDQATGGLMQSGTGENVCAPCTFQMGQSNRKAAIRVDDLIESSGGFPPGTNVVLGYAVIVVEGNTDAINLTSAVVNVRTGPADLSVFVFEPQEIAAASLAGGSLIKTIPRVYETEGNIFSTPNATDTMINVAYAGGLPGVPGPASNAQVELFLFDRVTGLPARSATNAEICNPCSLSMHDGLRWAQINLDDLIAGAGGFPNPEFNGFVTILVSGDAGNVAIDSMQVQARSSPFDVEFSENNTQPFVVGNDPPARTFVFPHLLEANGSILDTPNTFDTSIFVSYLAGLPGLPPNTASVDVDLFLFDKSTGQPALGANLAPVCFPCALTLDSSTRTGEFDLNARYAAEGGIQETLARCFAVITVEGADAEAVSISSFVTNAKTGPFDVSIVGLIPESIQAALSLAGAAPAATRVVSHLEENSLSANSDAGARDVTMHMLYGSGLAGLPGGPGATVDIYLFNPDGTPLQAVGNTTVCNPCTFSLGGGAPHHADFNLHDAIVAAGGFATPEFNGRAIIEISGDAPNVSLSAFQHVSNTGPSDINTHSIPVQPVPAPCPADTDGSGAVGITDLLAILSAWGPCPGPCPPACNTDINEDCVTGIEDLLDVLAGWGRCPLF